MKKERKTKCPKCKGMVVREPQNGVCNTSNRCLICGWREWFGFPDTSGIQRELEPEPIGSGHGVPKRSHKKKQVGLTYAGGMT